MPRTRAILNSFTGGETSPEVWGRTETDQWATMVERMRNVVSDPRGGAIRRDGLHYVLPTKFPQKNSRLIPFVFSREQSYILEFGDNYVRFFRDQGYVEDIGNVVIYLGDGTTTSFVYPYPSVAETSIEVYDENGVLVPDGEMVTPHEAINTAAEYSPAFSDASWNVDVDSSGSPWTKNAAQVTSAVDSTAVLGITDAQVPVGGAYTIGVDIVSFSYTDTTDETTDATDKDVDSFDALVLTHTMTGDSVGKTNNISYSFVLRDDSGTQVSDFDWTVQFKGTTIASGQEIGVSQQTISGTVLTGDIYLGDQITLTVHGTGDHPGSIPIVAGTVSPTTLGAWYQTNPNAKLEVDVQGFGEARNWVEITPSVGTVTLYDSDEPIYSQSPTAWIFRAQPGLQITLENPSWKIKTDGYFIEFNTAPPNGSLRLIRDAASSGTLSTDQIFSLMDQSLGPIQQDADHTVNGSVVLTTDYVEHPHINQTAAGEIFEIQSPFAEEELEELYYAQANDVMVFATDGQRPWRLTRWGAYDWRWDQPTFIGAPWEGESNYYLGDGSKTVYSFDFASTVDSDIKIYFNDELQTSGYTIDHNSKEVTFTPAPPDGMRIVIVGVNTYNPLDGYPRTVAFFQERLYFGGTVARPQTLWGSRAADFYYFAVPDTEAEGAAVLAPDDAAEYTIAAYTHEAIEWLSSERVLVIGTSSTEHRLAPDQYIATNRLPTVSRMSAYGGAHVMPAFMGNLTVFVQTAGNQVRTFEQSGQSIVEKWDSIELDWMASHLTKDKVKQLGYALNPNSILFMVTLAGDFLTMTYEPGMGEKGEIGWAKHETDGNFKSCAVIPEFEKDEIWAIVEREGKRYVEFFDSEVYTDSTLTYPPDDGNPYPPLQAVGGLDHLEGKEVTIVADGSTHPDLIVTNGQVELNDTYQKIEIGLKYIPEIKLQRMASGSEPGNLQGMLGRWVEVWLRIVDSAYPLIDGVRAAERQPATQMGVPEPVVTGDVKAYHVGFDRNKQLTITQDLPLPMHITAVYGVVEVNGG